MEREPVSLVEDHRGSGSLTNRRDITHYLDLTADEPPSPTRVRSELPCLPNACEIEYGLRAGSYLGEDDLILIEVAG